MRTDPAGAARFAPQIAQLHRKLFARLDGDRDNRLSFGEMRDSGILRKTGVARTDAEEKAAFDKADTNHDGVLSRGESFDLFNGLMQGSAQVLALITALVGADEDPAAQPSEGAQAAAEQAAADREAETTAEADDPHKPQTPDPYAAAPPPRPRLDLTA